MQMTSVRTGRATPGLRAVALLASMTLCAPAQVVAGDETIPRTWDDKELESLEIPLPRSGPATRYIPADYYYRIPVRPIYKTYPVYHPAHEPAQYMAWLQQQEPQIIFDASKLHKQQDWIDAGAAVFQAPIEFEASGTLYAEVRDPAWYEQNGVLLARDGVLPVMRWVIREKGKVELGILACAMCHTRVMPDGSTIVGAQGNFPDDRAFGFETRLEAAQSAHPDSVLLELRDFVRRNYSTPWLADDRLARVDRLSLDELASALEAIPPGVCARQGSSLYCPPRIPDLIGVKDRRYLDATGRVRHRGVADLMRYAALNQGADMLSLYGDFRPAGRLPDPATQTRYSDEQLYALALYVYSLQPPANPNHPNSVTARGEAVFQREGCANCHPAPLYTNNKLSPVEGFKVPERHRRRYDVDPMLVGTDPELTVRTRRGTGYYKVPSLKGLWYRGPLEHNGSVATLEDWFDPRRLRDDYMPTGFRGAGVRARAVRGHPFGLDLSAEDRAALVAFLRTL